MALNCYLCDIITDYHGITLLNLYMIANGTTQYYFTYPGIFLNQSTIKGSNYMFCIVPETVLMEGEGERLEQCDS
jgi:hypothetical protein